MKLDVVRKCDGKRMHCKFNVPLDLGVSVAIVRTASSKPLAAPKKAGRKMQRTHAGPADFEFSGGQFWLRREVIAIVRAT